MTENERNISTIEENKIIPVIRASSIDEAISVSKALQEGGVKILEFTFTIPNADIALREISKQIGEQILLGAGSVLDEETARIAILSGANFIVSPVLNTKIIKTCKRYSKIAIPGALTPTEILIAWENGADFVKIYPIENVGGYRYIKAIKLPMPYLKLIPTGGIDLDNIKYYLEVGADAVGVGSSLIDTNAIKNKNYSFITERALEFNKIINEFKESKGG